jgi:polyphosphate kinase
MPRNLFRRIELVFPIEDGNLRDRLLREIMPVSLSDNVKARLLQKDGNYVPVSRRPGQAACRSQARFIELALEAGECQPGARNRRAGARAVKLAPRPRRPSRATP